MTTDTTHLADRKETPTYRELVRRLEDAYKTIRAFVGEPSKSCPSLDCPYERVVRKALADREVCE